MVTGELASGAAGEGAPAGVLARPWLWSGRLAWLVLTVLVFLTLSQIWPGNYASTYHEWVVLRSRPAVQTFMSYERFVSAVTVLESLSALTALFMGFVVFSFKSRDKMGLLVSAFLILASPWVLNSNMDTWRLPSWTPSGSALVLLLRTATLSSILLFFFLFPDGRFCPRWTRWLVAGALTVFGGFTFGGFAGIRVPIDNEWLLFAVVFFGSLGVAVIAQLYRYRTKAGPVQRQQTKMMVLGFAAYAVYLLLTGLVSVWGRFTWGPLIALLASMLLLWFIPLALGFSILRYRLWDIDILIRRTLVYSMLTAALTAVYFGGIVLLQALSRLVSGRDQSSLATVLSTLAIAALFTPLRRRIQSFIDRRFYRSKYNAAQVLAAFNESLREEVDLSHLTQSIEDVVRETMQPAHVSLWLREGEHPSPER